MNTEVVEPVAARLGTRSVAAGMPAPAPSVARPLAPAAAAEAESPSDAPVDASEQAALDEAVRMLRGGRVNEAEKALLRLLCQRPDLAGVHANLGIAYRQLGRLDAAAAELEEAVRRSPQHAGYHNQLGLTWRMLGRFDQAQESYETAIGLDPAHAGALINLAVLFDVHLGQRARAAALYDRGAELLPGEAVLINRWLAALRNRHAGPAAARRPVAASEA